MSELVNYSIETDYSVWLSFKDGHSLRVAFGQLPKYLDPRDLKKVRRAMKLRQDFLHHNMPKTLVLAITLGLAGLMLTGGQALAHLWWPTQPVAPSGKSQIVHNTESTAKMPLGGHNPSISRAAVTLPQPVAARVQPVPTLQPDALKLNSVEVVVAPLPTVPAASPALPVPPPSPSPAPVPSPTPAAAGGSKVGQPPASPTPSPITR